jgi:hypothetical protein
VGAEARDMIRKTKAEAQKRLRQVEYFKHKG